MPFKLSGLLLNRVDLCPAGSNPGAEIVLFKSKEGRVAKQAAKKQVAKKKTPVKKAPAAKSDARKKKQQEDLEEDDEDLEEDEGDEEEDVEKDADEEDDEEVDEDEEEDDEEEDDAPTKKRKSKKAVKKASAADDDETEDDEDDDEEEEVSEEVLKTLHPSVRRMIEKNNRALAAVRKQAEEAAELAEVEKDKRETVEYIEKAKADIPHLTGTSDEKGALLRALYSGQALTKKMADKIVTLLKTGDKAVREMLMTETGGRGRDAGEDTAMAALEEKRAAILKAEPKLTKEQAMAKAVEQNPDLFKKYRIEKSRAARDRDIN